MDEMPPAQSSEASPNSRASQTTRLLCRLIRLTLLAIPWHTAWIYFEPQVNGAKWQYGTLQFYASETLVWFTVAVFLVWFWRRCRRQGRGRKFSWSADRFFSAACLVFVLYLIFSPLWSSAPELARQQGLHIIEAMMLFFVLSFGPLPARSLAGWLLAGAVAPSIFGIYQFVTQSTFGSAWLGLTAHPAWEPGASILSSDILGRWLRAYGSFPHPNAFGGYLAAVWTAAAAALSGWTKNEDTDSGEGAAQEQRHKLKFNLVWFISLGFVVAALFFTFSRAAWLAFGFASVGVLVSAYREKKDLAIKVAGYSLLLFVALVLALMPLVKLRAFGAVGLAPAGQTSFSEARSLSERRGQYKEAWEIILKRPWLGVGPGNYTAALMSLYPSRPGRDYQPAHAAPIIFFAELGAVGFFLMLTVIVIGLFFLNGQPASTYGSRHKVILFLFLAPLAGFDHYLYSMLSGLLIMAVFLSIFFRPQALHSPSTSYPQNV